MKTRILTLLLATLLVHQLWAQPGTMNMTPKKELADGPLVKKKLLVPDKFKTLIDSTHDVYLPGSYRATVFYMGGLSKPRVLEISPKGILHVIDFKNNGSIYALPDKNNDDVADSLIPVVTGIKAHCFKFYQKDIYVAEETRILICSDLDNNGFFETKTVLIDSIGLRSNHIGGGHNTRTILIDENKQKIYVSIGSSGNVVRDINRAQIEQYNLDGTGRKVFATGIRNAVGMAIDPLTGNLWANNNGSDQQGNNIPPEWISPVEDSGFYGFPFAYGNQVWFNMEAHADYRSLKPITLIDTLQVLKMKEPGGLIQAHSAPMELEYTEKAYSNLHDGFFTALHGSWNRSPATGFKLIFLQLEFDGISSRINSYTDFMTGFLTDSINLNYWARPIGIAVKSNSIPDISGNPDIYISSDGGNNFILKLTCVGGSSPCFFGGINESWKKEIKAFPNPFKHEIQLNIDLPKGAEPMLFDCLGVEQPMEWDKDQQKIKISELPNGIYILQVKTSAGIFYQKMIHEN